MEFYRSLLQSDRAVQLVVVGREPLPTLLEYLTLHKFKPERVQFLERPIPGVTGTPTLILVDSQGRVREAWRGQMDATEEARLREMLSAAPAGLR
jgi:streptogramin lyase